MAVINDEDFDLPLPRMREKCPSGCDGWIDAAPLEETIVGGLRFAHYAADPRDIDAAIRIVSRIHGLDLTANASFDQLAEIVEEEAPHLDVLARWLRQHGARLARLVGEKVVEAFVVVIVTMLLTPGSADTPTPTDPDQADITKEQLNRLLEDFEQFSKEQSERGQ